MNTGRFSAGASRFAHFAGLSRKNSRRAAEGDDDNRDDKNGADEDDDGKDASEDDNDEKPAGKRGSRARRSQDDDDDGKDASEGDGDDGDDDDKPAGKRGSRARRSEDDDDGKDASEEDDDDDQDELNGKGAKAQARRREQARITHILSSPAAANNLALAVSLACETRMSRQQAVKVLKGQSDNRRDDDRRDRDGGNRHARRDRQDRNVALGSDATEPSGKQGVKASWDAAWKKVGAKAG